MASRIKACEKINVGSVTNKAVFDVVFLTNRLWFWRICSSCQRDSLQPFRSGHKRQTCGISISSICEEIRTV